MIRRNINLLAISMLVIFLYGSMVWGIFPYRPDMSFESHLMGLIVGVMLALFYRHEGPGPTSFIKDMEDEPEEGDENETTPGSLSDPDSDKEAGIKNFMKPESP
jgi:hypothetical protein